MPNQHGVGFGVRLTRREKRRLDRLARATGRSKGAVVRALICLAEYDNQGGLHVLRHEMNRTEAGRGNF